MGNSGGVFGGNGSVNWRVDAENPENGTLKSEKKPKPGAPKAWLQEGKDEAPPEGKGVDFVIAIELPAAGPGRDAFLGEMRRSADNPPQSGVVTLHLPIRRFHDEQIKITWPTGQTLVNP